MDFEDMYELAFRIENARQLIEEGNLEGAERVLKILLNDLRGVIYPNNPFEIIDELKGGE